MLATVRKSACVWGGGGGRIISVFQCLGLLTVIFSVVLLKKKILVKCAILTRMTASYSYRS